MILHSFSISLHRCFSLYVKKSLAVCGMVLCTISTSSTGADIGSQLQALKEMSIEGLLNLEVTSVSKKAQKLWSSAAAIHVITQEDIRRSGATSIPEILRLAPGVSVAKINANAWAITARGFNGRFSNKLLVLIDGRSVYTPLYSGVYWDVQDTLLSDIERIEIIRGPGATIWGANAVNGVINIITKSTLDTQGGHVQARVGNEERAAGEFRYGGLLNDSTTYRLYAKAFNRDGSVNSTGIETPDDWDGKQIGFRLDSDPTLRDNIRLQGDVYNGTSGQTVTIQAVNTIDESEKSGGNIMLSWERILNEDSGFKLQFFYDRTNRIDSVTSEKRDTYDIDFNHYFDFLSRHHINWGLGYHLSSDILSNVPSSSVSFDPTERTSDIWSGFIQDEIVLLKDELTSTWGVKAEHNSYTGWEFQPSARLSWMPDESLTIWGAVSAAVRSPSRVESDFNLQIHNFPVGNTVLSNTGLQSEKLTAVEFGLRKRFSDNLILDAAIFYNRYKDLRTVETIGTTPPNAPPYFLPPTSLLWVINQFGNQMSGNSYGIELAGDWQVKPDWKLKGSYSWLTIDLELDATSNDIVTLPTEGYSPEHQLKIQSMWNVTHNVEFDTSVYFTSQLDTIAVPSYTRVDLRLAWYPTSNLETSLILQNAFDDQHFEFSVDEGLLPRAVERSIYGQVTWKFK